MGIPTIILDISTITTNALPSRPYKFLYTKPVNSLTTYKINCQISTNIIFMIDIILFN